MQLSDLLGQIQRELYLFNPESYGRIYTFVDFANVRHWAKAFWPSENKLHLQREIGINELSHLIETVHPAKKFFYYGYHKPHPELADAHELNMRHRSSWYRISKAQKAGFSTRQKEIKEISNYDENGKFAGTVRKCNFDIEMAMDMLRNVELYDTVFLWSGDSDFHKLLEYLKIKKKKKIVTVCARGFASNELDQISDLFVPADPFKDTIEFIRS